MALKCWVDSANDPPTDFPIENLPYGVFRSRDQTRIGVAIGDEILDLHACADAGLLDGSSDAIVAACKAEVLNPLMALGSEAWSALRRQVINLLTSEEMKRTVELLLVPMRSVTMQLPAQIGDFTD